MKLKNKNLLLIFTRNPELGKCKTRLATKVGDEAALQIYNFLLSHTVAITEALDVQKYVYYSEEIWKNDIWNPLIYEKRLQEGENLGQRMFQAFKEGFASGFEKIIIIGSDMYDLSTKDLENAFSKLGKHDHVIGPAEDGGYYLLGMTSLIDSVFQNKDWGTESVLNDTLDDLKNKNLCQLPMKNDVDHYEDIKDIEAFEPYLKHINE